MTRLQAFALFERAGAADVQGVLRQGGRDFSFGRTDSGWLVPKSGEDGAGGKIFAAKTGFLRTPDAQANGKVYRRYGRALVFSALKAAWDLLDERPARRGLAGATL